jgi:hypothetical protein
MQHKHRNWRNRFILVATQFGLASLLDAAWEAADSFSGWRRKLLLSMAQAMAGKNH